MLKHCGKSSRVTVLPSIQTEQKPLRVTPVVKSCFCISHILLFKTTNGTKLKEVHIVKTRHHAHTLCNCSLMAAYELKSVFIGFKTCT